jgi:hypothetical protein
MSSRAGDFVAKVAELGLWVTAAALIANAAGMRLPYDVLAASATPAAVPVLSGTPDTSANPLASPSLAAPPTPAPTLSPLVRKFQAFLAKKDFQFQATGTGTQSAVGDGLSVNLTHTGSLSYKAGDESDVTKTTQAGSTVPSDSVYAGAFAYERVNGGPWVKKPRKPSDTADWRIFLSPTRLLVDSRVETKNGAALHRLEVADPAALNAEVDAIGTVTDANVTLIFWTKADGTPVVMRMEATWSQDVGGVPAKVATSEEFVFTKLAGVSIAAPANPWQWIVDDASAVAFGVPPGWSKTDTNKSIGATTYEGASGAILYLTFDANGMTLEQAAAAVTAANPDKVQARTTPTVAGQPAIQLTYHRTKQNDYLVEAVFVHGGKVYEIGFLGSGKDAATNALAAQILGTLEFTK